MRNLKKQFGSILGFSRRETNAFLLLIPILVLLVFSAPLVQVLRSPQEADHSKDAAYLDSLVATMDRAGEEMYSPEVVNYSMRRKENEYFSFDPNLASKNDLIKLGIKEPVAERIIRFRSKGGSFKTKDDLLKIYGIDSTLVGRLNSHIQLPDRLSTTVPSENHTEIEIIHFDLNSCDTTLLKQVAGIGSVFSTRIVKYRDLLGGYVTYDQLYEVYGLDSLVVQQLKQIASIHPSFIPNRLNLNSCTWEQLAKHPYISHKLANAIVAYRFQHGEFSKVEDIRKIHLLDDKTYLRMATYVTVENAQ